MASKDVPGGWPGLRERCEVPPERVQQVLNEIRREIREERALEHQLLASSGLRQAA